MAEPRPTTGPRSILKKPSTDSLPYPKRARLTDDSEAESGGQDPATVVGPGPPSAPPAQPSGATSLRRGLRWDEETLAEHDVERGTRRRIEEPKTPYHRYADSGSENEDDSMSSSSDMAHSTSPRRPSPRWEEAVSARLVESEHAQALGLDLHLSPAERLKRQEEEDAKRAAAFAEHRKKHYDEFQKMRQFRHPSALSKEEDSDSDSDSDNSNSNHSAGSSGGGK